MTAEDVGPQLGGRAADQAAITGRMRNPGAAIGSDTTGVRGVKRQEGHGVQGQSTTPASASRGRASNIAMFAECTGGIGLWAKTIGGPLAALFSGKVLVTGTLSKGGGSFKIDHPLDPENKYLYHSFVESPDMKNIYDGVAKHERDGAADIDCPNGSRPSTATSATS